MGTHYDMNDTGGGTAFPSYITHRPYIVTPIRDCDKWWNTVRDGWRCPRCDIIVNPDEKECPRCNKTMWVYGSSGKVYYDIGNGPE